MIKVFTAESVTSGHPDKLADLIADTILDECLMQDEKSVVACEVLLCDNTVTLAGEITTKAKVDYINVAEAVIQDVGYDTEGLKFNNYIHNQSHEIEAAVFNGQSLGAGDQGIMYGYAIDETFNFMPLCTNIANSIMLSLEDWRKKEIINGLLPDGKVQVSLTYEDGRFVNISTIIISTQHTENKDVEELRFEIRQQLVGLLNGFDLSQTEILINPSGRFTLGGFKADTGLTGRKIIVDSYGGFAHHGGGAFSGKDASKVDRSGAYMARYIAKNLVAAGVADGCEVALAYAIGVEKPVSVDVSLFGKSAITADKAKEIVLKVFDLSPQSIINTLKLREPVFTKTTVGGHFGKTNMTWENLNKITEIRQHYK